MNNVNEAIILAGYGGQGVMLLGKVLADAGMREKLYVTWLPSYGAEVRGGTAYAMTRISSRPIASPFIAKADSAIIMNEPSLVKFEDRIVPGGLLILNTSLASRGVKRKDLDVIEVPLTEEAMKLGNVRVANMIAASIYAAKKGVIRTDTLVDTIKKMGAGRKELIDINMKAVERGVELA